MKIGIIGLGFVGQLHLKVLEYLKLGIKIECYVYDISPNIVKEFEKNNNCKAVNTFEELLNNVDAVIVATPTFTHYNLVMESLKRGKHVSCEKPLGLDSDESEKLLWLEKEKGIIANCCYNIIRIPAIVYAKKIIDSEKLGEIVSFRGSYDNDRLVNPKSPFEWRMIKKYSNGGSLCDLGINILAVSQFLVGDITSVCGMTNVIHKKRKDLKGNIMEVENDDIAQFIFEYKNGAMGYISSNRVAPGSKQDMKFKIHLTKGAIRFSLERMNEIMIYKVGDIIE